MRKLKDGWTVDMILNELMDSGTIAYERDKNGKLLFCDKQVLASALTNKDIIPPIKAAIRATLMNGRVEYPDDFDPSAWSDPIIEAEEKWEMEREDEMLGKCWWQKKDDK